jgi:tRNA A-37 threonylcarbamoyl transferase component Bud32
VLNVIKMEGISGRVCSGLKSCELRDRQFAIWEAFGKLWKQGILHGDVAPRNVIVEECGSVRIIDLGLACRIDDSPRSVRLEEKRLVESMCGPCPDPRLLEGLKLHSSGAL